FPLEWSAIEPAGSAGVNLVKFRSLDSGHVGFDLVPDPALQVREVAIALREAVEQILVEHDFHRRIHWIEPILLIDRLPQHQAPATIAVLKEIEEAASTHHIADYALDWRTLGNRHLGLRDCALAGDIDRTATEKVQDANTARPALIVDLDELLETALEPGRHHAAFGLPDGAKTIPQARVSPHRPVFHQFTDSDFVGSDVNHFNPQRHQRLSPRLLTETVNTPRPR